MSKTLVQLSPVSKGGKLASTSARGHLSGKIVHAVLGGEVNGFWGTPALCGATPGKRGYGWTSESQEKITCEKCLKRLPVLAEEKDDA